MAAFRSKTKPPRKVFCDPFLYRTRRFWLGDLLCLALITLFAATVYLHFTGHFPL